MSGGQNNLLVLHTNIGHDSLTNINSIPEIAESNANHPSPADQAVNRLRASK
jgi:hypothetical protein